MDESYVAIDNKIALNFHKSALCTKEYPNDYGEMRNLRIELQKLCGVTELEAINILINRNVTDYVWKYNFKAWRQIALTELSVFDLECEKYVQLELGKEMAL